MLIVLPMTTAVITPIGGYHELGPRSYRPNRCIFLSTLVRKASIYHRITDTKRSAIRIDIEYRSRDLVETLRRRHTIYLHEACCLATYTTTCPFLS